MVYSEYAPIDTDLDSNNILFSKKEYSWDTSYCAQEKDPKDIILNSDVLYEKKIDVDTLRYFLIDWPPNEYTPSFEGYHVDV